MKQYIFALTISLISFFSSVSAHSEQPRDINVEIDVRAIRDSLGKIYFEGKTNLPDHMELLITLHYPRRGVAGQNKVKIRDGKFSTGYFSDNGEPWPDGMFFVDITNGVAQVQTPEIRQIIGEKGEYLKGEHVEFETFFESNMVSYVERLFIGDVPNMNVSYFSNPSACPRNQQADYYYEWSSVVLKAIMTAFEYTDARLPNAVFLKASNSIYFQVAGEDQGKYHIHLLAQRDTGTSLVVLSLNFDMCANPANLDFERKDLFSIVVAKFNGVKF